MNEAQFEKILMNIGAIIMCLVGGFFGLVIGAFGNVSSTGISMALIGWFCIWAYMIYWANKDEPTSEGSK